MFTFRERPRYVRQERDAGGCGWDTRAAAGCSPVRRCARTVAVDDPDNGGRLGNAVLRRPGGCGAEA
ncbi:hypothetical protein ACFWWT_28515, partial [Streptomyces sp. NPDC058676]